MPLRHTTLDFIDFEIFLEYPTLDHSRFQRALNKCLDFSSTNLFEGVNLSAFS